MMEALIKPPQQDSTTAIRLPASLRPFTSLWKACDWSCTILCPPMDETGIISQMRIVSICCTTYVLCGSSMAYYTITHSLSLSLVLFGGVCLSALCVINMRPAWMERWSTEESK
uniref:Uncharacterized protein n=1 Tax=Craspedostauros australis TaxID=1486917 RepID=A0A7R9WUQ5_9STRA